jgi:hypothetical protein
VWGEDPRGGVLFFARMRIMALAEPFLILPYHFFLLQVLSTNGRRKDPME